MDYQMPNEVTQSREKNACVTQCAFAAVVFQNLNLQIKFIAILVMTETAIGNLGQRWSHYPHPDKTDLSPLGSAHTQKNSLDAQNIILYTVNGQS